MKRDRRGTQNDDRIKAYIFKAWDSISTAAEKERSITCYYDDLGIHYPFLQPF